MIVLREITPDNFEDVIRLTVSDEQSFFVSRVDYSLAQAWVYKDTAFPFAIYADDVPVGFVMLGYYKSREQYTLWKFLIDKNHQNKGYGKKALQLATDYLIETFNAKEIYIGVLNGNNIAKHLYISFGFKVTGRIEDGMEELKYVCEF